MTSTESANFALSLLRGNNCYDVVIADREMPEMDMYKFVDAVYSQCVNILVICKLNKSINCYKWCKQITFDLLMYIFYAVTNH